jgi:hypothetical protein
MAKLTDERVGRQSAPVRKVKTNGNGTGVGHEEPIALTPEIRTALAVARDYPVFPCDGISKSPLTKTGFKEATQDAEIVAKWWRRYPQALIGVPTGSVSGLVAIDCDPKSGDWFQRHRGGLGTFRMHRTRRGKHLLYQYPESGGVHSSTDSHGIDVRGDGGYVIWWPAHGGEAFGELGAMPEWLLKVTRAQKVTNGGERTQEATGEDWDQERVRVIEALKQLDPDCGYDEWRDIAAAISHGSGGNEDGEDLFVYFSRGDYWSSKPTRFPGEEEVRKKYRSFKNQKDNNITLASLFQMVKDKAGKVPPGRPEKKLGKQDAKKLLKRIAALSFDSFAQIQKKAVKAKRPILGEWLTPGAWLMVGRPKMGKSWLLLQMMLCLAKGRKFLDFEPKFNGYEMLALCAEDDDARIQRRVKKLGGIIDPAQTHVINRECFLELAKEYSEHVSFIDFLRQWIKAHPKIRLVVIDTEASARLIWGTRALPDKGYQSITEVDYKQTAQYDQLAVETHCVIILTNHTGKMTGKRAQVFDVHETINRSNMALAGASGSWVLLEMPGTDPNDSNVRQRRMGMRGRDLEEDIDLVVSRVQGNPTFVSEGAYTEVAQSQVELEILRELLGQMEGRAEDEYVTTAELAHGLAKGREAVKRAVSRMAASGRVKWNGYRITIRTGKGLRLDKLANSCE